MLSEKFHPKHYCGVFGVFGCDKAAELTYLGLFALQHRGEESAGIVTSDGKRLYLHKAMGLVGDAIPVHVLENLPGRAAIGHVRYSTTGSTTLANAQPLMVDYSRGQAALAHNGNLVNAQFLRAELEAYGSIFTSTTDSEIFIHLMAKPTYKNTVESVLGALKRVEGAYSMVLLTEKELIGMRDPHGFRPLCLGKLNGGYVIASETCAFDLIEAEFVREIKPGEVLVITEKGPKSYYPFKDENRRIAQCIFEHVYFVRPDSHTFGESVGLVLERL